jgi:hypothetical protein
MSYKGPIEDKSAAPTLIIPPEFFRLRQTMEELQTLVNSGAYLGDGPSRVREHWQALNLAQRHAAQIKAPFDFVACCDLLNAANSLLAEATLSLDPVVRSKIKR